MSGKCLHICLLNSAFFFPNTSTLCAQKKSVFFLSFFSRIIYLNPIFQAKNTLGAWKSYLSSLFSFSCSLAKTTNSATAQKQLFKENEKSTNSIFQNRWIQRIESYVSSIQTWLWGFIMLLRPNVAHKNRKLGWLSCFSKLWIICLKYNFKWEMFFIYAVFFGLPSTSLKIK